MRKILFFIFISSVFFFNCDKAEQINKADGTWEFGEASTFKYKEKTGVLTQKYLNQIVAYYAGLDSVENLVLIFEKGGTISAEGKTLTASSWTQDGNNVSFHIGENLIFDGKVYVKYINAKALNIAFDPLPEKIKSILKLVIENIDTGVTIDELNVYLDKID